MASWSQGNDFPKLRFSSDARAQFTPIRYRERLAEIGAVATIGTVGDSFDNALVETATGRHKPEVVRDPTTQWPRKRTRRWSWPPWAGPTDTGRKTFIVSSGTSNRHSSKRRFIPKTGR